MDWLPFSFFCFKEKVFYMADKMINYSLVALLKISSWLHYKNFKANTPAFGIQELKMFSWMLELVHKDIEISPFIQLSGARWLKVCNEFGTWENTFYIQSKLQLVFIFTFEIACTDRWFFFPLFFIFMSLWLTFFSSVIWFVKYFFLNVINCTGSCIML